MNTAALDPCAFAEGLMPVAEARTRASGWASTLSRTEHVALRDSVGRILAHPVAARIANPRFDQSAMDGYAVASASIPASGTMLRISGRVAAGSGATQLEPGTAIRIFTGAPLPSGADAVVMQEHVWRSGDHIQLRDAVRAGANVRLRGEDMREGDHLLSAGQEIDWRHVGLLASQGFATVDVKARPRVVILSTGTELRGPSEMLDPGAIHDSNGPMLMALARRAGFDVIDGGIVDDDVRAMAERLRRLSGIADLIVTSGGVSVGEEDHAANAVRRAGGSIEKFRMALKPGKSAAVGAIGNAVYLGLPGNPLAAVVVWRLLGQAILDGFNGGPDHLPGPSRLKLKSGFTRKPGLTEFIPGRVVRTREGDMVEIIERFNSGRIRLLANADALVECEATRTTFASGEDVIVHNF